MTFNELKNKALNYPLFKVEDVFKWFPKAKRQTTLNQLNSWVKKGYLENIRRSVYKLSDFDIKEPFIFAGFIYNPSYISTETALNYYSIIPDIPFATTSVATRKTKNFKTEYGSFLYNHIKPELFFGFKNILSHQPYGYSIAIPEKALFDYLYLHSKEVSSVSGFIEEMRFSFPKDFDFKKLEEWLKLIPENNKKFYKIIEFLTNDK
jgi:predicted transcriptional regulator of viral defense system